MSLGDLTKLPAMVLAWENRQEVFVMLVFVVVFLTGGFYVSGQLFHPTGTPPWLLRPVKTSTSSELYPGFFGCFTFTFSFLPRALRFWAGIFYPQTFFTLHSFPTFLTRFVTQVRAGTPHPGSSSVPAITELSLPAEAWSSSTLL